MAERKKTGGDGIRPFPTPPRDPKKVRVFALVVGINDYTGGIPKLNGCLKDVEQVEGYLRTKFGAANKESTKTTLPAKKAGELPLTMEVDGRLHLCTLKDREATYGNIIRGFREHLSNATDQDTVWFHFSGHGSEQFAAKEFLELDPNGRDQTLVCYRAENDAQSPLFLADKELAVLLHEISKKKPHILVSLDACHSGSGTRDVMEPAGIKPRAYKFLTSGDREDPSLLPGSVRSFDTYLDGYYKKMGKIEIPPAEHVLLSACESVQTAGDMARGGVFTTSLIQTLNDAGGPIHYARLFTKTRARASKLRRAQNPQFEAIDGFDPYSCFLEGWPMKEITDYYEVFRRGSDWFVRCGAIHGLPAGTQEKIRLMISSDKPSGGGGAPDMIAAHIEKVGAQHSKIKLADGASLAPDGEYFAEVLSMPAAPIYVRVHGDATAVDVLKAGWDASKNILVAGADEEAEPPALEVEATKDGGFTIRDANTGQKFVEVPEEAGELVRRVELVKQNLDKIARWKRMIALDNPNTKIRDLYDFELLITDKEGQVTPYKDREVKIYGTEELFNRTASGNDLIGINFRVKLKKAQQDLFLYAFDLSSGCAIKFRNDEEKVMRADRMNAGDVMPLRSKAYAWGLGPDDDQAVRWFKLLVTTEELDVHQLEQSGLIGTKDVEEEDFAPEKISEDWSAETIKVTLLRARNEVPNKKEDTAALAGGRIRIKGHAGVSARISMASANAGERSSDPANKLALFELQGHQMVDFNDSRDLARQNVLELTNLQVSDPKSLETEPLEIVLSDKMADDELMLPIAFDGRNFRVIGDAAAEGDETVVRIRELPEVDKAAGVNPFGDEPIDRSLTRALKMAFFKLVLKKPDQNLLRYAHFQEDGSIIRRDEGLAPNVAAAKNILLVLHGIIGDTKLMTEDLAFVPGPDGKSMKDSFDLILTYDYENLNTPIEDTAVKLKEALAAVGIQAGDDKKVTILAHSMGGLVSRWFIEREGGNQVVDRLILAGTPNAGSNFGKIEGARKFAITALDVAANFVPNLIPFSGYLFKGLQTAAQILVTLGQMDPDSDFLKKLNDSPDPSIQYAILGGDVTDYQEQGEGFSKLVESIELRLGGLVNLGEKHDIAVTLDSIRNEGVWLPRNPKPVTKSATCHHLNYFSSETGRQALGSLL